MIHLEITSQRDNSLIIDTSFNGLLFVKGEEALKIKAALIDGTLPEGVQLNIDDQPLSKLQEGYLKANLPFDELRAKMIEMLDKGVGYVFLDASENEYQELLRNFIDHSFRYDKVLYFSSFAEPGITVEQPGVKQSAAQEAAEEISFAETVEEESTDETKKEVLDPKRKLTVKDHKNLWINVAFSCFFSFLCFLLPIVTLGKENTSETLLIISVVIGFAFVLFSDFPLISYHRGAKKEGTLSYKVVIIHYVVHQLVSIGLAIGLFVMMKKNGYANLCYAYIAFIAIAPILSILYCLLFGGLLFRKK